MTGVLLLAVGIGSGVSWWRVMLLALTLSSPLSVAAVVGLMLLRERSRTDGSAALFCESVASELRAGASLRHALSSAADAVGLPAPPATASIDVVSSELASSLRELGDELRLTIVTAARSGSGAAVVFDELGSLALGQSEIEREVRVATAPGRATALVLIGAPSFFVTSRLMKGDLASLLASSHQRVVALGGLALFAGGVVIAAITLWRARI